MNTTKSDPVKIDLEQLLREGNIIRIKPQGYSMYPLFIPGRDEALIQQTDGTDCHRNDVLLFITAIQSLNGTHFTHFQETPMERIYNTYLKIIKNICTGSDHSVSVHLEDLPALAKLAQEHCTVPFVLPYLRSASVYPAMKQQVKGMMLNYYQIEHFTRLTVSLLRKNNIDCYLLKGLSLADCYPVPEYRKLGDLDLYLADPSDLTRAQAILESNGYISEDELNDHHVPPPFHSQRKCPDHNLPQFLRDLQFFPSVCQLCKSLSPHRIASIFLKNLSDSPQRFFMLHIFHFSVKKCRKNKQISNQ